MDSGIKPSLEEFKHFAKKSNLIAVSTNINMDLDTPVSVYYKLVDHEKGFILESVDTTHQAFGRYSFIGAEPFARLQIFKNKLMIKEGDLMKSIDGNPVDTIKKYMSTYKPTTLDKNLPLANGGMVGYFNFEVIATFDRVRNMDLDDDELLGQFMICKILVVFDALKNSARLIYFADLRKRDDLDDFYSEIIDKIKDIKSKLALPLSLTETHIQRIKSRKEPVDFNKKYGKAPTTYLKSIERAKDYIFAGDIFQVVPSRQFKEKITKPSL